jgi:DNA-binding response OmpR family regulator
MSDPGRILIADDEEVFRESTAELLRREGYLCDCVPDGSQALDMVRKNPYDLVIADIKMPGNPELQVVRAIPEITEGLPVILVTGYPSVCSAIQSIQLPVAAYLVKPFEFSDLRQEVRKAIREYRLFKGVIWARSRMRDWKEKLKQMEDLSLGVQQRDCSTSIEAFLSVSCHNIIEAIFDLKNLTEILSMGNGEKTVCHLLTCPRLNAIKGSMKETIEVLEKTKNSFKSKELGDLRKRLEEIIKDS